MFDLCSWTGYPVMWRDDEEEDNMMMKMMMMIIIIMTNETRNNFTNKFDVILTVHRR